MRQREREKERVEADTDRDTKNRKDWKGQSNRQYTDIEKNRKNIRKAYSFYSKTYIFMWQYYQINWISCEWIGPVEGQSDL